MTSLTLKDAALGLSIDQQTWAASGTVEMNSAEGYTTNLLANAEPDTVEIAYCNTQYDPSEIPSSAWTVCDGAIPITIAETPADRYYTYIRFRSEVGRIIIKVDYAAVIVDDTYSYNESADHKIRVYSDGSFAIDSALNAGSDISDYIDTAGTITIADGVYVVSGESVKTHTVDESQYLTLVYGIPSGDIDNFPTAPAATAAEYVRGSWSYNRSTHDVAAIDGDGTIARSIKRVIPGKTYHLSCHPDYQIQVYICTADMKGSSTTWQEDYRYTPAEGYIYLAIKCRRIDKAVPTDAEIATLSSKIMWVVEYQAVNVKYAYSIGEADPIPLDSQVDYLERNGGYAVCNLTIPAPETTPEDVTVYTYFGGTAAENLIATVKFADLAIIEPTPSGS